MNLIPAPRWIMDEWFSKPKIHGILQNVIQMLTWLVDVDKIPLELLHNY
jgi:hypothetical protein